MSDVPKKLCFVGLGNPGAKYRNTRHNLGFIWVDQVVETWGFVWKEQLSLAAYHAVGQRSGFEVHFLKPQTFMNESGKSWAKWRDRNQGECQGIVIIDDMDLELGRLKLKMNGGDGGHRGLRSIIESEGSDSIARLKIGIGRPPEDAVDHVLQSFTPEEKKILEPVWREAPAHADLMVEKGELAMNQINAWKNPAMKVQS